MESNVVTLSRPVEIREPDDRLAAIERKIDELRAALIPVGAAKRPSIQEIKRVVGRDFSVSPAELAGELRTEPLTLARHVAMYLAIKLTVKGFAKIGKQFGDRDHSTVVNGKERVERLMNADGAFRARVNRLMTEMEAGHV